jgi:APA family basic amino acid/polyamine antiporter
MISVTFSFYLTLTVFICMAETTPWRKTNCFFSKAGELNKHNVPASSLWMQCVWAFLLCLKGKYNELLALVIFDVLIFYALTILGIFILRKKHPEIPRPYKAFGYPVLPALYIILATALAALLLIFETNFTLPGLGVILLGIPVYYIMMRKSRTEVPLGQEI